MKDDKDDLEAAFPKLRTAPYEITSRADSSYNCIAWTVGDSERWWWPAQHAYWPSELPLSPTLETFVQVFRRLGYEICKDASLEEGWEKIAIYAKKDGIPTHATRQLPDGRWTSKLGKDVDIVHDAPASLSSEIYGDPLVFMRKHRKMVNSSQGGDN
ncbi:hypothetical protein DRN98_06735 [Methanosarcinales archaeon]|nr:MAG: hypothetical protein DRN98_06735 [Methanosarcinales archaeon]